MKCHSFFVSLSVSSTWGFHSQTTLVKHFSSSAAVLSAKPARLEDNEEGVLYVNDRCINCAACSYFAPATFARSASDQHHIVYKQPSDTSSIDFQNARAALAACPVSAIRATSPGADHGRVKMTEEEVQVSRAYAINPKVNGMPLPFPKQLTRNVWMLGHHSDKSFGAIPYLVKGKYGDDGQVISVMVDVPKFTKSAIRAVEELVESTSGEGPDYMFLTHVDDTAQHNEWREHFPNMKRIIHAGDLGEYNWLEDETLNDVEIILKEESNVEDMKLSIMTLDGRSHKEINCSNDSGVIGDTISAAFQEFASDFIILHTPGHSPGSIALLHKPNGGTIFTGDTYAYSTRDGGRMTGFPRYGNNLSRQRMTLECIKSLSSQYACVACGHGHPRNYIEIEKDGDLERSMNDLKELDVEDAMLDLRAYK